MITSKHAPHYPQHILKYCPKCGKKGFSPEIEETFLNDETYSNGLKCSDSDCGFILFINSVSATAAIIHVSDDTLLLAERKVDPMKGMLDLPGGFVQTRETAEDGLRREVFEEFNIHLSQLTPYKTHWNEYDFQGMVYFTVDFVFICEVSDWSTFNLNEPDEVIRKDVKIKDLDLDEVGFVSIKNILKDYKEEFLKK